MTIKNLISIYMYNDFCINIFDNKTGQKENINDDINLIKNEEAHLLNQEITYFFNFVENSWWNKKNHQYDNLKTNFV
ncbi:MAG: hypothetical protein EHV01_005545 [Spiroplasma sp. hy2]|uniref:hypothetical protein n=1 Tax=Spiroplasma sp. hy2 TaxID=2490850 RepID=UPI00383FDD55